VVRIWVEPRWWEGGDQVRETWSKGASNPVSFGTTVRHEPVVEETSRGGG